MELGSRKTPQTGPKEWDGIGTSSHSNGSVSGPSTIPIKWDGSTPIQLPSQLGREFLALLPTRSGPFRGVHESFQFEKNLNDYFLFIVNDKIFKNNDTNSNNIIEINKIISIEFL